MIIAATLTKDRHGQPLVVLDGQPFNGLEIRPGELRQMAQQLNVLADMATKLPLGSKHFVPTKVVMKPLVKETNRGAA
ncbi:hypothetical protein [Rhodoferax aquaticus]|uniref:Uncharacterized protein n=1 Tax=Rhodoferax aquaticus TaxID=2527691 RepID=A0A515ETB2_9BURK|nr:hypothetical protein [Rhodoferax aquaticus]QDL55915.1 hypothetical protein EXZ61_18000 [Rhodoferax aquaticus]